MAFVAITADGGVSKQILSPGTGVTPQKGHTVFAHYTGTLENGEVFDSSIGKPHRAVIYIKCLSAGHLLLKTITAILGTWLLLHSGRG